MNLEEFKKDCLNLPYEVVVQKHLLDGASYFFNEIEKHSEFQFKRDIANSLEVHIRDIAIVGSGKLGFSIKPDREVKEFYPFKQFDEEYNKEASNKKSDLDVAIVSNFLFDKQLMNLYEFTGHYVKQNIWSRDRDRNSLARYILKGWIRPDYFPENYKISDEIGNVQAKYCNLFKREVNIGIYKNWYFFENYHINNIRNIHLNLIANE